MEFDLNDIPPQIFDWEVTLKHTNQSKELAMQLCQMLSNGLNDFRTDILGAYEVKNIELLKDHAHKLNGGLCYVTAPKLHYLSTHLETACRQDKPQLIDQIIAQLPTAFDELESKLRKIS